MDRRCPLRFMEPNMTEKDATKYLMEMLKTFTTGSVLQMLADIHRKNAERAMNVGDELRASQYCLVEHALIVTGLGCDAALPQ